MLKARPEQGASQGAANARPRCNPPESRFAAIAELEEGTTDNSPAPEPATPLWSPHSSQADDSTAADLPSVAVPAPAETTPLEVEEEKGRVCIGGTSVWKSAIERKRKRQQDAKTATTWSTFELALDGDRFSSNGLVTQLKRHFSESLGKLDEFSATGLNRDELQQYVEAKSSLSRAFARRFREALRDRYGDAEAPTTDALANGSELRRRRLNIAARSLTFDEFLASFGSDGSLAEFKQYVRMQVSGDLLELDDYLVTDSDRQELFEQLVTAGQPTVSALDEFRTSLLGRYGQPCVDDFPRLVWE
mmetsp:Transcript_50195/g.108769  ORF Transcript_50195/g.108769 Transcript_50195/m.108769 type:complete len:305 (-) Transcript_50195:395-1309(-)